MLRVVRKARPNGSDRGLPTDVVDERELADKHGRFTQVAGREIYSLHWPAAGPRLVLIHGFGTANTSWSSVAPLFAQAGYDTYAPDLAGFGLSSKRWDVGYSHGDQADLLAAWMQHLGLDAATIIGHSMGGNVAAHLALRHPQRVERLVLAAPAVVSGLKSAPRRLGVLLQVPALRQAARRTVRKIVLRSDLRRFEASNPLVLRVLRTADWDLALLAATRDSWANQLTLEQLRSITVPTLLLWGADDTTIPVVDSERLRMLLPRAQAITMPGLGHLPHEEDPQRFAALVLNGVESPAARSHVVGADQPQ
ncbi:MAG: alpha/beta hydrolase [Chloroflexales bacterium]|nr:alpha/beta hydrolase [Chloroflexales bacterium]